MFLVVFLVTLFSFAEEVPFEVADPAVFNIGSSNGTYRVVLSPDENELSIFFSNFIIKIDDLQIYDFANYNISVPIEVAPYITVDLLRIDYQGLAYIPTGGIKVIPREHFFTG